MCLKTSQMFSKFQQGVGYKVLYKCGDGYFGPCYSKSGLGRMFVPFAECGEYLPKEWYEVDNPRFITGGEYLYPAGFHILPTLEDAEKLCKMYNVHRTVFDELVIVEVQYCRAFAGGIDESGVPCIVSSDMRIIQEV